MRRTSGGGGGDDGNFERKDLPRRPAAENLWTMVDLSTTAIRFDRFVEYVNRKEQEGKIPNPNDPRQFGVKAYTALRETAELFLVEQAELVGKLDDPLRPKSDLAAAGASGDPEKKLEAAEAAVRTAQATFDGELNAFLSGNALPYFQLIRRRVQAVSPRLLWRKMTEPLLIELIWSYWVEEGLLVQTLNAIGMRYQNRRFAPDARAAALQRLETEPLRPLNDVLWGYVQEEPHRLSVARRAYEYSHAYGLMLHGRAVSSFNPADARARFVEAFHNLLAKCLGYFAQADDLQTRPDAFPVLNGLKEVQLMLGEGAHNQFGQLPFTARAEMLVQQWILAQPEMALFLGGRTMTPYPEPWMDRIDTLKSVVGLQDVSVIHYADLAHTGERLLLSVRYGPWADTNDAPIAGHWARLFRNDIQTYVHAYRAVTGVDLGTAIGGSRVDATLPSIHLQRRRVAAVTR